MNEKPSLFAWLTKPIWLPWIDEVTHRRNMEEWERIHGISQGPRTQINLIKNININIKLKNKKTGEIIELKPEDYEIVEDGG